MSNNASPRWRGEPLRGRGGGRHRECLPCRRNAVRAPIGGRCFQSPTPARRARGGSQPLAVPALGAAPGAGTHRPPLPREPALSGVATRNWSARVFVFSCPGRGSHMWGRPSVGVRERSPASAARPSATWLQARGGTVPSLCSLTCNMGRVPAASRYGDDTNALDLPQVTQPST